MKTEPKVLASYDVMIQPDILYGLTVSKNRAAYELLAAPADNPLVVRGRWRFESAEDMTSKLSLLDMSAIDYVGVDQRLKATASVQVGHSIKGSMLLKVLGAAEPSE
jgi:hypothetical protein